MRVHEKLPQVNGKSVVKLLQRLGYRTVRQKGSHARLVGNSSAGEHHITIPVHHTLAKGTLNDILTLVALHSGRSRDELIALLK